MFKIELREILNSLTPNPKEAFEKVRKSIPPMVKFRLERSKDWLVERIGTLSGKISNVNGFVK